MIVLDTHVWLWWVNQDHDRIPDARWLQIEQADTVGVSVISCFEVAWLERYGRIVLPCERATWFDKALDIIGNSGAHRSNSHRGIWSPIMSIGWISD